MYELDGCPGDQRNRTHFHKEDFVHVARLEVRLQKTDRHEVGDRRSQHDQHHLHIHVVNLGVDVEEFDQDE